MEPQRRDAPCAVTDVAAWLREIGLAQYAASFAEQQIEGAVLGSLTDGELSLGSRTWPWELEKLVLRGD